ncbi:hypothetical protein ACIQRS_25555 [Streptomyces termitum]|uniref:hypothetical protein n=1 Tax=Streptomyces termitum TaxID=67368 RepID=UPI00167BB0F5|nr:hypothetical protein [Streptomyces termitum]
MESDDGVFLRSGAGDFYLKGASAYGWLSRLAPVLAAGTTLREVGEGLAPERAAVLDGLVRHLVDQRFVRALAEEPGDLLDAAERETFAEQLAYLAHHCRTPHAALRRVRDARVAVLGAEAGESGATAAARTLLRNGVGHLALLGARPDALPVAESARVEALPGIRDDGWREALAAWRPTALVVPPDGLPGALLDPLAALARRVGAVLLAARSYGDLIVKGPLVAPDPLVAPAPHAAPAPYVTITSACRNCLRLQLAEHGTEALAALVLRDESATARRPRHRKGSTDRLTQLLAAAVGSELATELFKHLSGEMESDLSGAVVIQHSETLESWREPLPRRHDCEVCGQPAPRREKELKAAECDLPDSPEDRLTRYLSVFGRTTGILREFADDDLPQAPVRAGLVRTGGSSGPQAYGFSTGTSHEARAVAVERALRHAASHDSAPLPVRRATAGELRAEGALTAGGGADGTEREWTPALRLRDDAPVWVPVEHALAEGGVGAGATFREVVAAGLTATLLEERLHDWLHGHVVPGAPGPVELDARHTPLALALLRTGTLTLQELPAPPARPDGVAVVLARHVPTADGAGHQVAAAGPTARAALATALRELSGLAAAPEAAHGPGGPHHVLCPPDWPVPDTPPVDRADLVPVPPDDDGRAPGGTADGAPLHGTEASGPADPTSPTDLTSHDGPADSPGSTGPADLTDLLRLAGPDRDVLFLELVPAGLPTTPAGEPVVLTGRVLLTDRP